MPEVRTYAPDFVLVIVGGIPLSGFAEDSMLTLAPMADLVTSSSGADGEVARSLNTDRRFTLTLTLQQTSPSNDVLSGIAAADRLSGGRMVPVMVQDLRGRTMFMAEQGWVSRLPDIGFGREAGDREWQITTGPPSVWFAGGNL